MTRDVRALPYMPLLVGRLLASDTWLLASGDEAKAAVTLWARSWQQVPAGTLPNDERILAALSGAGPKWRKVRDVALRGFALGEDGRLHHALIEELAADAIAKMRGQQTRTVAARAARAAKRATEAAKVEEQRNSVCDRPPDRPSYTRPDSIQRERERNKPPSLPAGVSPPQVLGTRLPEDWTLPDDWAFWARNERQDWDANHVLRVSLIFRDYWHAKPGKDGRRTDWLATWRNWVRRESSSQRANRTDARESRRSASVADILGAVSHDHQVTDESPRDITGESERVA